MTNTISKFRAWDVLGGGEIAVFLAAMILLLPVVAHAVVAGGRHDFTDDGFTGGGVCAACHTPHGADAAAGRLYPRNGRPDLALNAPARLCKECHNGEGVGGVGSLPTGPGWPATWTGNLPPALPPKHADVACATTYENCVGCHNHTGGFAANVCDCLSCHSNSGAGACAPSDIDSLFSGFGAVDNANLLSQHNIVYNVAGDLCSSTDNECMKCHPEGVHPTATAGALDAGYVVYPDDYGLHVRGDKVPKDATAKETYQDFCLSCHDGTEVPANQTFTEFNGLIPVTQVAPSDRSNPANQQTIAPWLTPPVPPMDFNNPPTYVTATPYFAYYEQNGHGAPRRVISYGGSLGTPLNMTCLASGIEQGCHTVHGSTNRFLIADDTFDFDPTPTGKNTVAEFSGDVCLACHTYVTLATAGISTFHSWLGDGKMLHDTTTVNAGWAQWTVIGVMNLNISGSVVADGVLPFYPTENDEVFSRQYPGNITSGSVLNCITCHDPHGTIAVPADQHTNPAYDGLENGGMPRFNKTTFTYDDPMCKQCHVP